MKAAFDGLANLNDPETKIYFDWLKSNRNTPLGKMVAELDESRWNNLWRKLSTDQGDNVRNKQEQVRKAEVQKVEEAKEAEKAKIAAAKNEAARLKAE